MAAMSKPHPERPRPTITIPADATEEERNRIYTLHVLAALSESMCPTCAGDLRPAEGDSHDEPTGRPWLHCQNCACYWQADHERQEWVREAWWAWEGVDPSPHNDWLKLG